MRVCVCDCVHVSVHTIKKRTSTTPVCNCILINVWDVYSFAISFPFFILCPSLFLPLLSFKADRELKLARSCLGADGSARVGEEGMEQINGRDGKIMTVALWVISRYSTYGGLGI